MESSWLDKKKAERVPQRLEDVMPSLKQTEEEKKYNEKFKDATSLLSSGNLDNAMATILQLKQESKPAEREISQDQEDQFLKNRERIAKALGYQVTSNNGKFLSLQKTGYKVQMKHFMLPVATGVNGGRISEIEISKGVNSATWDNGWDKEPKDEGIKKIFREIVDYLS